MALKLRASRPRAVSDMSEQSGADTSRKGSDSAIFVSESPSSAGLDVNMVDIVDEAVEMGRFVGVAIDTPKHFDRDAYRTIKGDSTVDKVLGEEDDAALSYSVRYAHGGREVVAFEQLLTLKNGQAALNKFEEGMNSGSEAASDAASERPVRKTGRARGPASRRPGFTDFTSIALSDDEDELNSPKRQRRSGRATRLRITNKEPNLVRDSEESSQDSDQPRRSTRRLKALTQKQAKLTFKNHNGRQSRSARFAAQESAESEEESNDEEAAYGILRSDVVTQKTKRRRLNHSNNRSFEREPNIASRRSERATRHVINMEEVGEQEIYRSDSSDAPTRPKATGAREIIKALPRGDKFRDRHMQVCDTCNNSNNSTGQLVYCQGCTLAYHKTCLGPRGGREHMVTKIGEEDFVLQCRRCINVPKKKDAFAPDLAKCQDCKETAPSCAAFRKFKNAVQEQKERDENGGEDPITIVDKSLINNPNNVLFRCTKCSRGFHFHHLESRNKHYRNIEQDEDDLVNSRFTEYSKDWMCKNCAEMPAKLGGIIAWRPEDANTYIAGQDVSIISEDDKEYLVKWENLSYFRAQWMSGAWTWGVAASAMRRAFFNRTQYPKMRTEDAIPEEWLRIDIVLDVKYSNVIDITGYEIDKARIKEVDTALIKYKGLGYEDAVWEEVPKPEEGDRWSDFVVAYNDWVLGRYVTLPSIGPLRSRLEKHRQQKFKEKTKQPENLEGGELMKYQVEGLNWLYYQWYQQKNGILADEMGLGKTIQIIAFLAMMVHDIKCYPFLIVVPNSTCANWRREIKQWAPQLRVVTYFGSSTARQMAHDYELFPEKSKTMKCHAVITSYEAAVDDTSRRFFKSVQWQGLIVDEGQRLKNDQSQLHTALNNLKIPFRILLTGTPLQNNARELFNLLQFLDDSINAAAMEEEYAEMTNEKIARLHNLIRPFILRRTKLQVLTFLPPVAQIILPVSMSVLQKRTYKGIIEQNPKLLRSLFSSTPHVKQQERVGLNNILMQLRKCLCHPFVYNGAIEERHLEKHVTHQNLVEASSKLQLLEQLLPKLQERGHRVLIFSQFLDMLDICEDFLEGMGLQYQRLDGKINSLEKQKRIDEFNAPSSPLFAFLLSTRAGGVGINLATADTVIILDPDFNPHQDIQAISRAHRIGQTKKVLCFQLMTRGSAEEKIMQIGRKKMALDEVVINKLDEEEVEEEDMESILKHGMKELFEDGDNPELLIRYDEASIEKLLDRTQVENTKAGKDDTAESQFSFARIWANDEAALQDSLGVSAAEDVAPDPGLWEKILKERADKAAAEAAEVLALGRGKRARQAVDYKRDGVQHAGSDDEDGVAELDLTPVKPVDKPGRKRMRDQDDNDTDFQASEDDRDASDDEGDGHVDAGELLDEHGHRMSGAILGKKAPKSTAIQFARTKVPAIPAIPSDPNARMPNGQPYPRPQHCLACQQNHIRGSCPLKMAPLEHCNICGLAHFGNARVCPHFKSETQVRMLLEHLKSSPEPRHHVEMAKKYLTGLKGNLVQEKKRAYEKAHGITSTVSRPPLQAQNGNVPAGPSNYNPNNGYQNAPPKPYQQAPRVQQPHHAPAHIQGQQPERVPWEQLPIEDRIQILTHGANQ
ncbi:hypothetical protein EJ08DRAFT_624115 [Tothia fuscella]|uniref:Chromatin remodeling factor mit1 n=1 Tax=Tothia fuscella TaxID=1048955 RepID=A0A9P4P1K1_9PEZI|nr:hypothetical protein EJ08DRAFT_624115 [Tothia fuscella]